MWGNATTLPAVEQRIIRRSPNSQNWMRGDPGRDWRQLSASEFSSDSSEGICFPVLREEGQEDRAIIQVISFPRDVTDPQTRADSLRSGMGSRRDAVRNSFTQEEFTSDGGLIGVHLRNCIIHNCGVARDSDRAERIYALERRKWSGQAVGLRIERCSGEDIGEPIRIDRRFVDYCLDLLERFFRRLAKTVSARPWP